MAALGALIEMGELIAGGAEAGAGIGEAVDVIAPGIEAADESTPLLSRYTVTGGNPISKAIIGGSLAGAGVDIASDAISKHIGNKRKHQEQSQNIPDIPASETPGPTTQRLPPTDEENEIRKRQRLFHHSPPDMPLGVRRNKYLPEYITGQSTMKRFDTDFGQSIFYPTSDTYNNMDYGRGQITQYDQVMLEALLNSTHIPIGETLAHPELTNLPMARKTYGSFPSQSVNPPTLGFTSNNL